MSIKRLNSYPVQCEPGPFRFKRPVLRLYIVALFFILSPAGCSDNQPPPADVIDPAVLDQYTGHYRITENYSVTITSQDGCLYYQPTTQGYGDKLSAKTRNRFFLEEWGENFIEFRKTPVQGKYDLFIVNPGQPPRRCPRIEEPIIIELEQVGRSAVEVSFQEKNDPQGEVIQTLQSLKKQAGLYTITYSADYSELVNRISGWDFRVRSKTLNGNKVDCSLFFMTTRSGQLIYGRNFDNEICDVLAGKYRPRDGYTSMVFTRISDLGFERNVDLLSLPIEKRVGLLAAPCFIADGMNEKGVVLGIASVEKQPVVINPARKTVFFMRLCREILDHAANVDEVIPIIEKYNIYDENEASGYSMAHHLLVSDAGGNSVVLENSGGRMRVIRKILAWQLALNSPLYNVNEEDRQIECQRYRILTTLMEENRERMDWQKGMQFLRRVAVKGNHLMSCWSSVYDVQARTIYLVLRKKYQAPLKLAF